MQAVILASGRGKRFAPLTDHQPKPLLPAANWPLLDYLLNAVGQIGVAPIFVTIGYGAAQMEPFLNQVALQHQVTPLFAPNWERGPLASFMTALPYLDPDVPCLLLPGDLYLSPEILRFLPSSFTEPVLLYDSINQRSGTLLQVDTASNVSSLTQSPAFLPGFYSVLPVLIGSLQFFTDALALQPSPPVTVFELLQRWLAQGHQLYGVPVHEGVWCDVDTPASLVALNRHLLTTGWPPTPHPPGTYLPSGTSMTGPVRSATLTLGAGSVINGPVLLGARVYIDEGCEVGDGTSLGAYTTVHVNASMKGCITLPHAHVPANVILDGAIVDVHGSVVR